MGLAVGISDDRLKVAAPLADSGSVKNNNNRGAVSNFSVTSVGGVARGPVRFVSRGNGFGRLCSLVAVATVVFSVWFAFGR